MPGGGQSVGARDAASLPIAWRLYLPQAWAEDPELRRRGKIPPEVAFQTKPQIALEQIRQAKASGLAPGVVLADAGYGTDGSFRAGVTELGLTYAVGVLSSLSVWPPGQGPLPPLPWSGKGRPTTRLRRTADHQPISAKALAQALPAGAWQAVTWREGSNGELGSRFAALRVRTAHRDFDRSEPHPQEWLLIEWPEGEVEPTKYWLSILPADIPVAQLVDVAKLRWRIERDYQELGLGHYQGRGWRGFHHHVGLCIAAYGFLVSLLETLPPSAAAQAPRRQAPGLPEGHRPRGAPDPTRTARPDLNPHAAATPDRRPGSAPATMSLLRDYDPQS